LPEGFQIHFIRDIDGNLGPQAIEADGERDPGLLLFCPFVVKTGQGLMFPVPAFYIE